MQTSFQKYCYQSAVASLVGLIVLGILWELWLAPLRPGGSWMVLKVIPLLLPLRGVIKRDVYTLQWSSMLILIYLTEGLVRAASDSVPLSATLGWVEVALVSLYFFSVIYYLKPYKKAAKKIARETIAKATEKAAK
ncbi:DUF2069 domain-containing protein [Actimicrobium sp. CCI2.3]|uniref:DUF2069 domain-containing protein n=1 Tax=Actimicrobium sp. CCI2.3 TaxID=3048616 RepID=UPI002AB332BF|nr:DUF2069 domain-containing protein [Actimicrobium sp. CCI2.3]MDY7575276.1 DUF2069 domain-containing protein [Actimicrobium sp. CCI2.3]MEB0023135.1 DUF2069 domain-containing protein [Actimicrobium sp. CCI2.3]